MITATITNITGITPSGEVFRKDCVLMSVLLQHNLSRIRWENVNRLLNLISYFSKLLFELLQCTWVVNFVSPPKFVSSGERSLRDDAKQIKETESDMKLLLWWSPYSLQIKQIPWFSNTVIISDLSITFISNWINGHMYIRHNFSHNTVCGQSPYLYDVTCES